MTVPEARARLAAGYYNSNPKTLGNPGGLGANGHQINFPQACVDLGLVLLQAGIDAGALTVALPDIAAAIAARPAAEAARDAAIVAKNQAQEIVGVDLTLKANLASPPFTGTPTAPTPVQSDNSNRLATTAYVKALYAAMVGSAPAALDAIYELAAALGNDPNFATSMATALAAKLDKTGGVLTGPLSLKAPGVGYVRIAQGDATYPGFIDFFTPDDVQRGFMGFGAAGGGLQIAGSWNFQTRPYFAGAVPWDGNNLAPVDQASAQLVTGPKSFITPVGSMTDTGSIGAALMVQGTSPGPAVMVFHRPSSFATYFGLDTDNQLKVGGWSMGAVANKIWHAGNDGAGSGLDCDYVRGAAPDANANASTIVKRDADGGAAFGAVYTSDYLRVTGGGGIYWATYGGGLYMSDATWVRLVGDKGLTTGGQIQAGVIRETSDARLKSDYAPLTDAGDLVDRTRVYRGKKKVGDQLVDALYVLAQDQRDVTPEVVGEGSDKAEDGSAYLAVNYGQLALIAIAALQEERRTVADLVARVARLEGAVQ